LYAYLQTIKPDSTAWIDARDILIVESTSAGLGEKGSTSTTGVTPLWDQTIANMDAWWEQQSFGNTGSSSDDKDSSEAPILVVTGFVAKTADGVPTTLKRSGSDYSATIFAKLVAADRVTMWKNTDGVFTADPRAVPEAFSIASLKYDEASELSYFGAAVLHPTGTCENARNDGVGLRHFCCLALPKVRFCDEQTHLLNFRFVPFPHCQPWCR